jgi:hypothetical protein
VFKFLCRHSRVTIRRAHPQSLFVYKFKDKKAWFDEKQCYAFIVCAKCNKVLNYKAQERIFAEVTSDE